MDDTAQMPAIPLARTTGLDHIVLKVRDVETSVRWYTTVLGLTTERLEEWRNSEVLFPSLRIDATTLIDLLEADHEGVNVDHFAVVVEDMDLQALADSGHVDVIGGPAELWGAQGMGRGLYIKDPDGNTVELRTYPSA